MPFPRYCHNDDKLFGEPCGAYGRAFESDEAKKTRGHGPTFRCPYCGYALTPTPPEEWDDKPHPSEVDA